jgi:hypothetical protein
MKRLVYLVLGAAMILTPCASRASKKVAFQGQDWLDAQSDPAAVNVDGRWSAKGWGVIILHQMRGSRQVSGTSDSWDFTGVVSGKKVYLIISTSGFVVYSAILTSASDSELSGTYERGLMKEEGKGRRMDLTK